MLYGKFSSRDLLKDLDLEHNEEVVNDRVQTPSCDVAEALAMTKVNTEVASFQLQVSSFEVTMSPLWGGRFTGQTDPLMARFNASLPFDWRLWDADITGSIAWARAITRAGLLTTKRRTR